MIPLARHLHERNVGRERGPVLAGLTDTLRPGRIDRIRREKRVVMKLEGWMRLGILEEPSEVELFHERMRSWER
jgi:hypothetical protein